MEGPCSITRGHAVSLLRHTISRSSWGSSLSNVAVLAVPRRFQAVCFLVFKAIYTFSWGPWQDFLTYSRLAVPQLLGSILT